MYTYIHIPMVFNPQAPTSAKADLRQRMCGAGVHACVFNPAPHPWCSALNVKLVDQCIYQVDLSRST